MDIDMIRVIRRDPRSPIVLVLPPGSLQTLPPPPPAYIRFFHPCRRRQFLPSFFEYCSQTKRFGTDLAQKPVGTSLPCRNIATLSEHRYLVIFRHLDSLGVEDQKDVKMGYSIMFGASNGVNGEKKGKKRPLTEDRCFLTPSFFIPSILDKVIGPEGLTMTLVLLGNRA
ncbi:NAP1-related protein 2 [Cucumis melo var. makuwa]|uniref:NAP1-related protein 2 n=1 Tax=Cucumis melo var. makuwa TaxID=1194695 RepID=A0A5A7VCE9_CUCMM|nr:NAP1-related protein 2 [Cucumis melo var. makuwa]